MASVKAPPRLDRSAFPFLPHMDGNNYLGDCTAVAVANCARAAAELRGFDLDIPTAKVIDLYSAASGYDGTPATDLGCVVAKMLAYQTAHGFDTGAQTPLVGAWGTIDPADLNLIRVGIAEGGAVNLGVALSVSDQTEQVWGTSPPAAAGDPTPGSWGLHSLIAWDWQGDTDDDLVRLGTWGGWQVATWGWVRQRTQEAHLLAWRQLGGAALGLLDYDQLVADGSIFAGWLAA